MDENVQHRKGMSTYLFVTAAAVSNGDALVSIIMELCSIAKAGIAGHSGIAIVVDKASFRAEVLKAPPVKKETTIPLYLISELPSILSV